MPATSPEVVFQWSSEIERCGGFDLLWLDTGRADQPAPLVSFAGDELTEFGRRARKGRAAKIGQSCLQFGVGDGGVDLLVELVDDIRRRVVRRANALPAARLVPRHKFAQGRDVRQNLRTRC